MENERKKIYDFLKSKKHITTTPYNEWVVKYFSDTEGAKKIFDFLSKKKYYTNPIEDFYKKYCCDLEWAKKTSYCTIQPKPEEIKKPFTPEEKTISTTQQQQNLVNKGYFIGITGPNKNGVDGTPNKNTKEAQHALDSGIDAVSYNTIYKELHPESVADIERIFGKQEPKRISNNTETEIQKTKVTPLTQNKVEQKPIEKTQTQRARVIKTINPNDW